MNKKYFNEKWKWFKDWALMKGEDIEKDDEKSFLVYLGFAAMIMVAFLMLMGCAVPKKKDAPHSYRVEVGKKCVEKKDGTTAWSYLWIARDDVKLVKCK